MERAKVLIVEDEVLVAMDLEATLEDLGFESVGIAADRATALSLAGRKPDVALVDLNLRDGLTGPEVGEKLATEHNIPVIFMTANPRMLTRPVPGAVGVVHKPYEPAAMGEIIAFALRRVDVPPVGLALF